MLVVGARRLGALGSGTALVGAAVAALIMAPPSISAQAADADPLDAADVLGWIEGEAEAPITVVEFTDLSCPYCASFHAGTRAELVREFVESGQVRWITLTYVSGLYPHSDAMTLAAECAGRQGEYWAFVEAAYADRDEWVAAREASVAREIERIARELGLDETALDACRRDPSVRGRVDTVRDLAGELGVRGTPTWFVDGFLVMGDLPLGYARQFIVTRLPGGSSR